MKKIVILFQSVCKAEAQVFTIAKLKFILIQT